MQEVVRSLTLIVTIFGLPLLTLVELWPLTVALFVLVLCAIIIIDDILLPVETSIEPFDLLCCVVSHGGNVFLPIKTSSEVPVQMLYWSSSLLSMCSTRSMNSEDRLWSIFRFQISPHEFCSRSHQYCCNESIDSESGVFLRCPAKKRSELG